MTYEELDDKIKNLLGSTESKVGDLIDDYNDFESDNNENPILIEKRGLWNHFDTLKSNIEMMLENSC